MCLFFAKKFVEKCHLFFLSLLQVWLILSTSATPLRHLPRGDVQLRKSYFFKSIIKTTATRQGNVCIVLFPRAQQCDHHEGLNARLWVHRFGCVTHKHPHSMTCRILFHLFLGIHSFLLISAYTWVCWWEIWRRDNHDQVVRVSNEVWSETTRYEMFNLKEPAGRK